VSGTTATLNWTIPLYERDNFSPSNGQFRLHIQSNSTDNGFYKDIPGPVSISSASANGISLSAIAIDCITLSGTVNISVNGIAPLNLKITAKNSSYPNDEYGSVWLSSPGVNAPWSIVIPALGTPANIYFLAEIYTITGGIKEEKFPAKVVVLQDTVSNADISGITLNYGNIRTITLSGIIKVSYNNDPVPCVVVNAYPNGYSYNISNENWLGSTTLYAPKMNDSWSMTVPALDTMVDVRTYATGFSNSNQYPQDQLFSVSCKVNNASGTYITIIDKSITGILLDADNRIPYYPDKVILLEANTWVDGEITQFTENYADWYSINVTNGTTYYLWWNGFGTLGTPTDYGDGAKTLDAQTDAWYRDGSSIPLSSNCCAWNNPVSFTATQNGVVYIRMQNRMLYGTGTQRKFGTYGIVYSTNPSRPPNRFNPGNVTQLTDGIWINSKFSSNFIYGEWYAIKVTQGTQYNLWWNSSSAGDGTKSARIIIYAWYGDGTIISLPNGSYLYNAWDSPVTFISASNGIIYIMVYSVLYYSPGTYGLVYSQNSVRPGTP